MTVPIESESSSDESFFEDYRKMSYVGKLL